MRAISSSTNPPMVISSGRACAASLARCAKSKVNMRADPVFTDLFLIAVRKFLPDATLPMYRLRDIIQFDCERLCTFGSSASSSPWNWLCRWDLKHWNLAKRSLSMKGGCTAKLSKSKNRSRWKTYLLALLEVGSTLSLASCFLWVSAACNSLYDCSCDIKIGYRSLQIVSLTYFFPLMYSS